MTILNHSAKRETVLLSGVVLLFLFVYLVPISLIFKNAFSNHFSHGILIIAISTYMVWTRRDRLRQAKIRPALIMGSMSLAFGSMVLTAGVFSGTQLLEGLSLVFGIFGLVWLLYGSPIMRIVAIPISFLIFMFPIFDKIFRGYTDHLQLAAASIGAALLKMVGMPIFHLGDMIQLPHITMVVGEACSGVNHMVALMTFGIFLGYVTEQRWLMKLMFVVMGLAVGIIANGIRVALIGIWTGYFSGESFHGPFDVFYSSFIFLFGLVIIIVVRFALLKHKKGEPPIHRNPHETNLKVRSNPKYFPLALVVAGTILLFTWVYQTLARPLPFDLKESLDEVALNVNSWKSKKVDALRELYEAGNFDLKIKRIYYDQEGNQIKLFIGYLNYQRRGENIDYHPYGIDQKRASRMLIESNPSGIYEIGYSTYQGKEGLKQAYFWYDINGRIIPNRNGAKLATVIDAFLKRRTNGAVVIISTDVKEMSQEKERQTATLRFIKTILPLIKRSLNHLPKQS